MLGRLASTRPARSRSPFPLHPPSFTIFLKVSQFIGGAVAVVLTIAAGNSNGNKFPTSFAPLSLPPPPLRFLCKIPAHYYYCVSRGQNRRRSSGGSGSGASSSGMSGSGSGSGSDDLNRSGGGTSSDDDEVWWCVGRVPCLSLLFLPFWLAPCDDARVFLSRLSLFLQYFGPTR